MRKGFRFARLVSFGCLGLALAMTTTADAAPLRLRVRGATKLTARASRDQTQGELVLSGTLADDVGAPLSVQSVTIRVAREATLHDARVAEGLRGARGCDRATDTGEPRRGPTSWGVRVSGPTDAPEVVAITDEDGRFCFRARLDPDRYVANVVFVPPPSSPLLDGAEHDLAFDLSRRGLGLRFDPAPRVLSLDAQRVSIDAVAILDDDATPRVASALPLTLSNEKEELGRAVTDAAGRAHFFLPGAKLGAPGPGDLRVVFAGDGETTRASHVEEVERHIKVTMKVPAADRGVLAPAVPEDGIPLLAEVATSLGPLAEGSVEARAGEIVIGTAPVERGIARLTLTFTSPGTEAVVKLRYVPASPWYEPPLEPTIRVPIRGPSLASKLPIVLAGLAVLAFFLVGRVSGRKNKPSPLPAKVDEAPDSRPRLEIVRPARREHEGWSGRVVDAHDGTPVARARVWIERGTFDGRILLASAEADADGQFALPDVGPRTGNEEIRAEARLHARLVQPLPVPGEIGVVLAQRRRALLARLVTWARRRGPPFDIRPEPTPGHVQRAAADEVATARWAEAVERAAFGPEEIDARAEHEVEHLAPTDASRPPPKL